MFEVVLVVVVADGWAPRAREDELLVVDGAAPRMTLYTGCEVFLFLSFGGSPEPLEKKTSVFPARCDDLSLNIGLGFG